MNKNSGTSFYNSIRKEIEKEVELNRREKEVEDKEKRIKELEEKRIKEDKINLASKKEKSKMVSSFEKAIKSYL